MRYGYAEIGGAELGIDFSQIWMKTTFVLMPAKIDQKSMEEGDLAGPLVYCILLGMLLLLVRTNRPSASRNTNDAVCSRRVSCISGISTGSVSSAASACTLS